MRYRLSDHDRRDIVQAHAEGQATVSLAKKYGVSEYSIRTVLVAAGVSPMPATLTRASWRRSNGCKQNASRSLRSPDHSACLTQPCASLSLAPTSRSWILPPINNSLEELTNRIKILSPCPVQTGSACPVQTGSATVSGEVGHLVEVLG